ncbi:hypothetical protein Tco_0024060 [Tanacetum coccineum]
MAYLRSLHSHLQVLSKEDLKGTRIEHGFKWAFMSLFGQDDDTFTKSRGSESRNQDTSSKLGNDTDADDADIKLIYDEEPMTEDAEQHQVKSSLLDPSLDNKTTKFLNQSLESENIFLKQTVSQFEKDSLRMEEHCIALELKYQNQSLKSGQHGQFLNETTKTIEQTTSLIAQNAEFKAQLQEKGFAIEALKNELRKLTGNSVDTKWVPAGKIFTFCTSKVDSKPVHGSSVDISKIHECKQTLDLSAEVPTPDIIIMTSMIELESLFGPLFNEYFNGENQVVSKSSVVTTVDVYDKRKQQSDSTSSTSTLRPIVTADGHFDV